MPVIIIDGPEKAGKSTIAKAIVSCLISSGTDAEVVHWGPVSPDDRAYADLLKLHTSSPSKVFVWDRGWPSEYVYGKLMGRDRRMVEDPWLGAWLHDRAVQAGGLRVMLLGPSVERLSTLRSADDLLVDPAEEKRLYEEYATRFGWFTIHNTHGDRTTALYAAMIISEFKRVNHGKLGTWPPYWAGPWAAETVFVGEQLSDKVIPGGWLPFTSPLTSKLGRMVGDSITKCAWVNAHGCPPQLLRHRQVIIACGEKAQLWVMNYVKKGEPVGSTPVVIHIPHPSYMFRFKNSRTALAMERVQTVLNELP